MTLQDQVLSAIAANNPVRSAELEKFLPGLDHIDVDVAITQLMKANKVSLIAGYYDLVEPVRSQVPKRRFVATAQIIAQQPACSPMLTATEEAAASLREPLYPCELCREPQPISAFRQKIDGSPFKICKSCHAKRMAAPRNSTPIQPQQEPIGAQAPPAASSEHLSISSVQGTQPPDVRIGNPEALSPVPLERSIELRRTALHQAIANSEQLLDTAKRNLEEFEGSVICFRKHLPEAFK